MFSKACEYGIRAVAYLIGQSRMQKKSSLVSIASSIDSPEAYTSKILQQLVRADIIMSEKGPTGGFSVHPSRIEVLTLSDVVNAIDDEDIYEACGLGYSECDETQPCVIHHKYAHIRKELKNMLENTTLLALSQDVEKGLSFLKRTN